MQIRVQKKKILNSMQENSKITIGELSNTLNVGIDTINEHIAKLKKENRVKRVGGRKDG